MRIKTFPTADEDFEGFAIVALLAAVFVLLYGNILHTGSVELHELSRRKSNDGA